MSDSDNFPILDKLYQDIAGKTKIPVEQSYTAQLLADAPQKPARKVCEEATELLIEALQGNKDALISESADLLYHLLVVWVAAGVKPEDVWAELKQRQGISGLDEKKNR